MAAKSDGITLVLGGGGAKGFAHIGVLKVLEEYKIPIKCVAGTSMGAIIGSLIAAGYDSKKILALFDENPWMAAVEKDVKKRHLVPMPLKRYIDGSIFDLELSLENGSLKFPEGIVYGQDLSRWLRLALRDVLWMEDFRQLPIPFVTVATDLNSGLPVVLKDGSLVEAVRASSAYPGVFAPVNISNKALVDGGIVNNLPADIAKDFCGGPIVAVDVLGEGLANADKQASLFDISDRSFTILIRASSRKTLSHIDLLLKPQTEDILTFGFADWKKAVSLGERSAHGAVSRLEKFKPSSWRQKEPVLSRDIPEGKQIRKLESTLQREEILSLQAQPFQREKLEDAIDQIYAEGNYHFLDYQLKRSDPEGMDIKVTGKEKSRSPIKLRLNLSWEGEIQGKQDGNMMLIFQSGALNDWDGRWNSELTMGTRLVLETWWRQPVGRPWFFLEPRIKAMRRDQDLYELGERVTKLETDEVRGLMAVGLLPMANLELKAGYGGGYMSSDVEIGTSVPEVAKSQSFYFASTVYDSLDSANFPRRGIYLGSFWRRTSIDKEYHLWRNRLILSNSLSFFRFIYQAEFSSSLGGDVPNYDDIRGGGISSFMGLREDEWRGQGLITQRAMVQVQLPVARSLFWEGVFVEGILDWGDSFQRRSDFSATGAQWSTGQGIGIETRIGALHLIYGHSGLDHQQFYMSVGRSILLPSWD